MKAVLVVLFLCLSITVQARVGESYAAFLKRTGFADARKPTNVKNLFLASHKKDEIEATIYVLGGEIVAELYIPVTKGQVSVFLDKQGGNWTLSKVLTKSDGTVTFRYHSSNNFEAEFTETWPGCLMIFGPKGVKALADIDEADTRINEQAEKKKAAGF